MATVAHILLLTLVSSNFYHFSEASAHWMVTEDGKIQTQPDTMFNMMRPYDLVAMLKQEERSDSMKQIQRELATRTDHVKLNEERSLGIEQTFYRTDPDCMAAGKPLTDFDLYISTLLPIENKGIKLGEHIDLSAPPSNCQGSACPTPTSIPDCTATIRLDFSMHAFEHLEGIKDRHTLSGTPELGLKTAVTPTHTIDEYGSLVADALKLNKTSWVLYNMAAFYWRIKGNSLQVIECVRRALHYSPYNQKDVALINLGNILHRAHYSNEAAIVVHNAVDISKDLNVNHFTLGNIYAILGEYNKSLICFENTLKIQPDFEVAEKCKHAILCHYKLESALETEHIRLQKTLVDLRAYQAKHDTYKKQQEKSQQEQVTSDVKLHQRVAYEQSKIQRRHTTHDELCETITESGTKAVLPCSADPNTPSYLSDLFQQGSQEEVKENASQLLKDDYDIPVYPKVYPKVDVEPDTDNEQEDKDWPTKEECDNVDMVTKPSQQPTFYLPPRNKGFTVKGLLTVAQGLELGDQHELPWYPPICGPIISTPRNETKIYGHLKSLRKEKLVGLTTKLPDNTLKEAVTIMVEDDRVTEEEIGQRILTALKQTQSSGMWLLYTIAGLYWMLRGHTVHSIECFQHAVCLVPETYRDVPLVNLASVLYRLNYHRDAGVLVTEALAIDDNEPVTHALMGNIQLLKGNNSGADWHLKQSLLLEPQYPEAKKMLLLVKCKEKFNPSQSDATKHDEGDGSGGCAPKGDNSGLPGEHKYVCKMEQGEEKCVMETPVVVSENSEEIVTTSCNCNFPGRSDDSAEETDDEKLGGCPNKARNPPRSGHAFCEIENVAEYYEKRGFCKGEECNNIHISTHPGQKSHIKLSMVDGNLHQRIIIANSPNDIHVDVNECLIYSDGSCSVGCNLDDYRNYVQLVLL